MREAFAFVRLPSRSARVTSSLHSLTHNTTLMCHVCHVIVWVGLNEEGGEGNGGKERGREDDKLYTAAREEGREGQVTDSRELTPP